jgi:hypothetical protein
MTIKTTVKAGNKTLFVENFEYIPALGSSFHAHGSKYKVLEINQVDENTATIMVSTPIAQNARQGGAHAYKPPKGGK